MSIGLKLAKARTMIGIEKTGTNAFAKYSYYQIDEIYANAKTIFNELGIVTTEEVEPIITPEVIFLKFTLSVMDAENTLDKLVFSTITEPNKMKGAQQAQEAGATITYMTKYLYGLALMIDDGKTDPDKNNTHDNVEETKQTPYVRQPPATSGEGMDRNTGINWLNSQQKEVVEKYIKEYNDSTGKNLRDTKFLTGAFIAMVSKRDNWK